MELTLPISITFTSRSSLLALPASHLQSNLRHVSPQVGGPVGASSTRSAHWGAEFNPLHSDLGLYCSLHYCQCQSSPGKIYVDVLHTG